MHVLHSSMYSDLDKKVGRGLGTFDNMPCCLFQDCQIGLKNVKTANTFKCQYLAEFCSYFAMSNYLNLCFCLTFIQNDQEGKAFFSMIGLK